MDFLKVTYFSLSSKKLGGSYLYRVLQGNLHQEANIFTKTITLNLNIIVVLMST